MAFNNYRDCDPLNSFDEEFEEVKQPNTPKFIYNTKKDLEIYKKCCEKIYNEFKITNIDRFCEMYKEYESKKDNYYEEEIKEESDSESDSENNDDFNDSDYEYESETSDSDSEFSEEEKEDNYYEEEIMEESDSESEIDDNVKDPDYEYESDDNSEDDSSEYDSEYDSENDFENEVINNDKYKYTLKIIKFCECGSNTTKYLSREQDIINFLCDEFFYRYQEYCGDVEADIYSVIKKLMFLMSQYNVYDDYNTWNDRQYILSKQTVSGFFLSKSQEYRKNIKMFDLFELC